MPALAGNSGREPAVAGCAVPVCHAGGRGFESRRSGKSPCKLACCIVCADAKSAPTTPTVSPRDPKRANTARNRSPGCRFQADSDTTQTDRKDGLQLHETAGGQGSGHDSTSLGVGRRSRRARRRPTVPPTGNGRPLSLLHERPGEPSRYPRGHRSRAPFRATIPELLSRRSPPRPNAGSRRSSARSTRPAAIHAPLMTRD